MGTSLSQMQDIMPLQTYGSIGMSGLPIDGEEEAVLGHASRASNIGEPLERRSPSNGGSLDLRTPRYSWYVLMLILRRRIDGYTENRTSDLEVFVGGRDSTCLRALRGTRVQIPHPIPMPFFFSFTPAFDAPRCWYPLCMNNELILSLYIYICAGYLVLQMMYFIMG